MDDHAVAHHALGVPVEDAGRHQVQLVLGAGIVIDGVPGVGAALQAKIE